MTALNMYFPKLQSVYKFLSVGKEVYPPVGWGKLSYNLKYYTYKIIMFRLIYY